MTDVLLSIVVPCRDREVLLKRLLDSIGAQRAPPAFEVIVVDDGSQDASNSVAAAHSVGARCERIETSHGPGYARNLGANSARGQFLMFVDSDDVLPAWTLATCARVIASESDASMLLLTEQAFASDASLGSFQAAPLRFTRYQTYAEAAASGFEFSGCKCVLRAAVFAASDGFATNVRVAEDQDLGFRLSCVGPCLTVHAPVCIGRGIGHSKLMDDLRAWLHGMRYLMAREAGGDYPGGRKMRHMRNQLMSRSFRSLNVALVNRGLWREAIGAYTDAFVIHLRTQAWRFILLFPAWAVLQRLSSLFFRGKP